jgi:hypothetical protein
MLSGATAELFSEMLKGGHNNSLGRAEEVVEIVLGDPTAWRNCSRASPIPTSS